MKSIPLFPVFLAAFFSCQPSTKTTELPVWPVAEQMEQARPENLLKTATEVKRIPLETSDSILIREIGALAEADGLLYVKHDNQCSVFDQQGKFLRKIGSRGEGPNEYQALNHFFIKDGEVYLYEAEREIVRIYTPEGVFKRDFPTGESYNAIYPLAGDTYLGYMDNVSGNEWMKIGFFTEEGLLDTIPYTQQFEHKGIYWSFANEGVVFKDGNEFCFKEFFNDTIFRVEADHRLAPLYIADLGAMKPSPEIRHQLTDLMANIWDKAGRLTPVGVTAGKVFFNILAKGQDAPFYWDKKTGKLHLIELSLPDDPFATGALKLLNVSEDGKKLLGYRKGKGERNPEIVSITLPSGK